jgi:hypothetical protein
MQHMKEQLILYPQTGSEARSRPPTCLKSQALQKLVICNSLGSHLSGLDIQDVPAHSQIRLLLFRELQLSITKMLVQEKLLINRALKLDEACHASC